MTTINLPKLANGRAADADEVQAYFDAIKTILDGGITAENMKARYLHVPYTFTWSMDDDVATAGAVSAIAPLAETRFKLPTIDGVVTIKDIMLSGSYYDAAGPLVSGNLTADIGTDSVVAFTGITAVSSVTIADPAALGPGVASAEDSMSHVITAADNYMRVLITPGVAGYWRNVTVSFNLVYTIQE